MIDKTSLIEYNDLCMQVVETEEQLKRLTIALNDIVHDSVKGSNPEYPFEPITFHISGISPRLTNDDIAACRRLLTARRDAVKAKRLEVEAWVNTIPVRMQRIVRMKYFEGMTWPEVALRLGGRVSGDAVRMEFTAFMKNESNIQKK